MNTEKFTKAFEQSVPQIYRGSKSPKFWHSFFAFVLPSFQIAAIYRKSKTNLL